MGARWARQLIADEQFVFDATFNDVTSRELDRLLGRSGEHATTFPTSPNVSRSRRIGC